MFKFSEVIIDWYHQNQRDLPWRKTTNPYKIWLSEVILQQTRVVQGLPYYIAFTTKFPTVYDLANASEDEVLFTWKGLGYYSRARNLHKTAKIVANEFKGVFPNTYLELLNLKGVGEYTAAAIASFCFNEPVPVVDGNVYRVLSRVFDIVTPIDSGIGKKTFKALANELIDNINPAIFNQAIMEFGALQCVPKNPNCEVCPLLFNCQARSNNTVINLPVKSKKLIKKNRYFNYLILENNNKWAVNQRNDKDIWANLFEFPMIETSMEVDSKEALKLHLLAGEFFEFNLISKTTLQKHLLTHQNIYYCFWKIQVIEFPINHSIQNIKWFSKQELSQLAIPKLLENYLSKL
jgi:A/G-specific adenine glycosylase